MSGFHPLRAVGLGLVITTEFLSREQPVPREATARQPGPAWELLLVLTEGSLARPQHPPHCRCWPGTLVL